LNTFTFDKTAEHVYTSRNESVNVNVKAIHHTIIKPVHKNTPHNYQCYYP